MEVETPSSQREATSSCKKEGPFFGPPVPRQRQRDDRTTALQKDLVGVLGNFDDFTSLISQRGHVRSVYGVAPTPLTPSVRDAPKPRFPELDHDVTDSPVKKDVHKPSTSETKPSTSGVRPLAKTTNGNRVRTTETAKVSDKVRTGGNAPKETQIKSSTGASACQALNGSASLSIKIDGRNLKRRSRSPTSIKTCPDAGGAPTSTVSTQEALESMQSLVQTPLTALDGAPFKFPPNKPTATLDSSSSRAADKKNCVSPVQPRASHKEKASTASDDRTAKSAPVSTTLHSDVPPKKRQPRADSEDRLDKLGLALSSDESDDDDVPLTDTRPKLPAAATISTDTHTDKKTVMTNCVDSKPATVASPSQPSPAAPLPWDGILEDIFGPTDVVPSTRETAIKKEKKESVGKSSKSSRNSEKAAKDAPANKAATVNNVDCDQNGVQSPDSGFVEGSLDGGAEDIKPTRASAADQASGKAKKKLKRVASIMGDVGRVSPLLSPVREFPPLTYLPPPDARPSLKCRIDLTGVDESDRLDLFDQPSTSTTQQLNDLDELPLSERLTNGSAAPDENRKNGGVEKKAKKAVEVAERIDKDKRADKTKKKKRDDDDRMPKLSKEVPFRIKDVAKEKPPAPPVLAQPSTWRADPPPALSSSKVNDKQKLSKANSSDSSKVIVANKVKEPSVEPSTDGPPAKKPRMRDQQSEPALLVPKVEPKLEPKLEPPVSPRSGDFMALAPNEPAKLDLGANNELLNADYYQNKRARPIKHTADREADKLKRTLFYLESVVYFVLSVRALGEARGEASQSSRPPTMIKDTCDLLRQITNRFVQASAELPSGSRQLVSRIQALSLRAQSVLCYRLYSCRQLTVHRNYTALTQYTAQTQQRQQQGAAGGAATGQHGSPTESGYGTGGSSTGGNSARHTTTPSPTPSPASSTNSGGSNGVPANHVSVPRDIDALQKQQLGFLHQLMWSHRHWEDSVAKIHPDDQPFFEHLDRVCGPLKMDSTLAELSVYLATAVNWMRAEYELQLR